MTKKKKFRCQKCRTDLFAYSDRNYHMVEPCKKCIDEANIPVRMIKEALEIIHSRTGDIYV